MNSNHGNLNCLNGYDLNKKTDLSIGQIMYIIAAPLVVAVCIYSQSMLNETVSNN